MNRQTVLMEQEEPYTQTAQPIDKVRFFPHRVRSLPVVPGHLHRRALVSTREETSYKLPKAASSNTSSQNLYEKLQRQKSIATTRQSNSSSIRKQPGWEGLCPGNTPSQRDMDVVPGERNSPHCYQGRIMSKQTQSYE